MAATKSSHIEPSEAESADVGPAAALPDPLAARAAAVPERLAVIAGDQRWTYGQLNIEVNRLVGGLESLGLQAGERAVWCGPNSTEVVVFMHACRKLGLVAVPASYRSTSSELAHVVNDSQAALVVVDSEYAATMGTALEPLTGWREVVVFHAVLDGESPPPIQVGAMRLWTDVLALGTTDEPPPPADLGAAMMYTSGTTGRPKGAIRTRSDRALIGAMLSELRFGAAEVHLTTGPLYHAGPNAFALLTHICGGTLVLARSFDPEAWLNLVGQHQVTSTFSAPTHLKRIVSLPAETIATADMSSMRTLIANAAPVPYALKQEVIAKLGDGFLFEVYGSTELGLAAILRPEDQLTKPGSCGKPYGGIELRVVDQAGQSTLPGQPGELFVRTALAIDGYRGNVEQMPSLDGGWHSVGDIAYLDDEGYLYICDRGIDMIITGGMNVYPAEVEAVLHAHPDVFDVAVIGLPDDEWGERVHAVMQPRPGHTIDVDALSELVDAQLAGFKRPRSWDVRESLPRTESGKLLKRVLRQEYRSENPSSVKVKSVKVNS